MFTWYLMKIFRSFLISFECFFSMRPCCKSVKTLLLFITLKVHTESFIIPFSDVCQQSGAGEVSSDIFGCFLNLSHLRLDCEHRCVIFLWKFVSCRCQLSEQKLRLCLHGWGDLDEELNEKMLNCYWRWRVMRPGRDSNAFLILHLHV